MKKRFYYLLEIQYLGFRYHGWQKQPQVKTVQEMVLKTLNWVHRDAENKVLASGRTDAKVSVNHAYIEHFTRKEIQNQEQFLNAMNWNLPADIRVLSVQEVDSSFNIIQSESIKEYHYYFAFGDKFHPYSAAFMGNFIEILDIELMQKAAKQFEGEHDFYAYTFRPNAHTQTIREVISCELVENTELTASFFPEKSYVLRVKGEGFKRNQIRLMMGALVELGKHQMSYEEFLSTFHRESSVKLTYIAPASGLHLHGVKMLDKEID